jgi:hypothetical protein
MPHRALVGAASFPQGEWWWSTGVGRAARVGATAGVGDFERGVGQELGVPAGGVEEVVVAGADEHDVVEGCRAAMGDPADVVGFRPVRRSVAAGEPTVR